MTYKSTFRFIAFGLVQGLTLASARVSDAKICNLKEVYDSVCAIPNTQLPPDSTGLGFSAAELKESQQKNSLSLVKRRVTQKGHRRLQKIFDLVLKEYQKIASELSEPYATRLSERIANLRLAKRFEMELNYELFDIRWLENYPALFRLASELTYNPSPNGQYILNKIYVTPAYANNTRLSDGALVRLMAHETAHHLQASITGVLPPSARSCVRKNYIAGTNEDEADFLASVVLARMLRSLKFREEQRSYVRNALRHFCGEYTLALNFEMMHSPRAWRLINIARNAQLGSLLGCEALVDENGTQLKDCTSKLFEHDFELVPLKAKP